LTLKHTVLFIFFNRWHSASFTKSSKRSNFICFDISNSESLSLYVGKKCHLAYINI